MFRTSVRDENASNAANQDVFTPVIRIEDQSTGGWWNIKGTDGADIQIDNFHNRKGRLGSGIYQAIYAWAHQQGKRVVPDVEYTDEGRYRRISAMLSSALRFRDTDHMLPNPEWGLDWKPGEHAHNIGQLAALEAEMTRARLGGLFDNWIYDLVKDEYRIRDDSGAETVLQPEEVKSRIDQAIVSIDGARKSRTGQATVRRALASVSAQKAHELGLLRGLVFQEPSALPLQEGPAQAVRPGLERIRYARRSGSVAAPDSVQAALERDIADIRGRIENAEALHKDALMQELQAAREKLADHLRAQRKDPGTSHDALVDDLQTMAAQTLESRIFSPPKVEKNFMRSFLGLGDIFLRAKGLEFLGKAMRKHVDLARKYQGDYLAPFRAALRPLPRRQRQAVLREFEDYWKRMDASRRGGPRPVKEALSAQALRLVELWERTAARIDRINQDNGVAVYDPDKYGVGDGGYRAIRTVKDYFPRTVSPKMRAVMANPVAYPEQWKTIIGAMVRDGMIAPSEDVTVMEAAARRYLDKAVRLTTARNYMASIEHARTMPLPTEFFDYSFDGARRYIVSWSERMAQIEAYGQALKEGDKDLFDLAQGRVLDDERGDGWKNTLFLNTRELIEVARRLAYSERDRSSLLGNFATVANPLVTGLYLGNHVTILKNLISGIGYTATTMGNWHAIKGMADLADMRKYAALVQDAHERGILMDDLMNMQADLDAIDNTLAQKAQTFANFVLNGPDLPAAVRAPLAALTGIGLYTPVENFVRAHGLVTAKSFLRDALKHASVNPDSRASRLYTAWFERNGFDVDKLRAENGKGVETDRFLRGSVNISQGGYRFDQVPAYVESPTGRFLFKFQKWGTQALRNFYYNAWLPAFNPGKDKQGRDNPRNAVPLVNYLILTWAMGEGIWAALGLILDVPEPPEEWANIVNRFAEGEHGEALGLATERVLMASVSAGALGTLGNYGQMAYDVMDRSRFKNPMDPIGLQPLVNAGELLLRLKEQKTLTLADADEIARRQVSAYRVTKQATVRTMGLLDVETDWSQDEAIRLEMRWLANKTRRFAEENGVQGRTTTMGRIGKTEYSPYFDAIHRALLRADSQAVAVVLAAYKERFKDDPGAIKKLAQSVLAKRPIRVGGSPGVASEILFLRWAERNLAPEEVARIREIDARYERTAIRMGLMNPPKEVSEKQLEEYASRRFWRAR